jgi:bacterioferritin (cytochrome b1)
MEQAFLNYILNQEMEEEDLIARLRAASDLDEVNDIIDAAQDTLSADEIQSIVNRLHIQL